MEEAIQCVTQLRQSHEGLLCEGGQRAQDHVTHRGFEQYVQDDSVECEGFHHTGILFIDYIRLLCLNY